LLEEISRFVFTKPSCFHNSIKELTASRVFHRDGEVGGGEEELIKPDDVGVARELSMINDFTFYVLINL